MANPGLNRHHWGPRLAAQALRDVNTELICAGPQQIPKQIVDAAIQKDVDALGLSSLSGVHGVLFVKALDRSESDYPKKENMRC